MKHRILLVEDNELWRLLLCAQIRATGYPVLIDEAKEGREALLLFEKNHYALVLLDMLLPDTRGSEVARLIRNREPCPPLVACTGLTRLEENDRKLFDDWLTKPTQKAELSRVLTQWVFDETE